MSSLNQETNSNQILNEIKHAETMINEALWKAVQDSDHRSELATYEEVKSLLLSFSNLSPVLEKERNRVLSYCLMRIDNALGILGDTDNAVARAEEALEIATRSEDALQIARCSLALGVRLSEKGQMKEANDQFSRVIDITQDQENEEMQQLLGWTLIVKGNMLMKEGLYSESLEVLEKAESILQSIRNYAGIAQVNEIMASVYQQLGDSKNSKRRERKAAKFWKKAKTEKR